MSQTNYSRRLQKTILLAFLGPLALALPASYLLRQVDPGEQFWLVFIAGLMVIGAAFLACVPWWRTMDDMQRHGHMVSWYWGGMAGGVGVLVWIIAALGAQSDQVFGAVAVILGQTVGFFVFWSIWMWRQRGAKE